MFFPATWDQDRACSASSADIRQTSSRRTYGTGSIKNLCFPLVLSSQSAGMSPAWDGTKGIMGCVMENPLSRPESEIGQLAPPGRTHLGYPCASTQSTS
jgi:hypothetical protein